MEALGLAGQVDVGEAGVAARHLDGLVAQHLLERGQVAGLRKLRPCALYGEGVSLPVKAQF